MGYPALEAAPTKRSDALVVLPEELQGRVPFFAIDAAACYVCLWFLIVTIRFPCRRFSLRDRISASKSRVFFLDYGGTLVKDTPHRPSAGTL